MESTTARAPGPDDGARCEARLEVRPEAIVRARGLVGDAAREAGLRRERIDDLLVAVSEACTNAIEAHTSIDTDERVVVRCWVDDNGLEVRISDRGPGFDPAGLPDHPPVTDPARLKFERGLGIPLIRALVDVVEFSSSGKGTEVRLVMRHAGNGDT
jgi:serine/threonine-protein kinase RsbW